MGAERVGRNFNIRTENFLTKENCNMERKILNNRQLKHLAAIVFLIICLLIYYRDHILGNKFIPFDNKDQFYPFAVFITQSYRNGEIPLWNPYIYSGTPSFADPLYMTFYPGLIFALIPNYLTQHWFDLLEIGHIAVGGIFVFLLIRDFGANIWSSLIGAILFMISGPYAGRVQHVAQIYTTSLVPVVLYLVHKGVIRRDILILGLAGIVLGCALMIGYQVAVLFCLVVGAFFMVLYLQRYGLERKRVLEGLGLLTFTLAMAGGFSAIQVVPSLEFSRLSNRPSFDYLQVSKSSLPPSVLFTMIFPNLFGSLGKTLSDFRGSFDITESYLFIGAVPAYFLMFSVLKHKTLKTSHRFFLIVALMGLLFALGKYTPVHPLMYHLLIFLRLFKRTSEGLFIYHLGVSIVVALGFDQWNKEENRNLMIQALLLYLACYLVLFIWAWEFAREIGSDHWYFSPNIVPLILLVTLIVVFKLLPSANNFIRSLGLSLFPALIFIVVFWDLLVTNSNRVFNATPYESIALSKSSIYSDCANDVSLIREGTKQGQFRFEAIRAGSIWSNAAAVWAIPSSVGYSPLVIKRYEDFASPLGSWDKRSFSGLVAGLDSPLYDLLGVKYIISTLDLDQIDPLIDKETQKFSLIPAQCFKIYENKSALPLAFVVHKIIIADQELARGYLLDQKFSPRESAVIEGHINARLAGFSKGSELLLESVLEKGDSVELIKRTNNNIELYVRTSSDGVLVVNDVYYPGWKAYIDGSPSEVFIVNYAFKGVYLLAGEHSVELVFDPPSFHWGLAISLTTVLIWLVLGSVLRPKFCIK